MGRGVCLHAPYTVVGRAFGAAYSQSEQDAPAGSRTQTLRSPSLYLGHYADWSTGFREKFVCLFVCFWRDSPQWAMASFTRFLDHTRRTTVGRTPLDKWSARCRDLYLTTYNSRNRQTSMPPVGFEPTISAGKRPQTYVSERAATGTGIPRKVHINVVSPSNST